MIYIPCQHERLHNGGWLEEQHFLIAGRQESVAIAPCMLFSPTAERVRSWLETLTNILHRKIVHEFVLRQILLRRYGEWFDFRNVGELLRGLPVFYRHHSDRYYLLRDVISYLPRVRRSQPGTAPRQIRGTHPRQEAWTKDRGSLQHTFEVELEMPPSLAPIGMRLR